MDIQSLLTQAIEFIVMSFVALMIFDFVDGLYVVPLPPIAIAQSNANSKYTVTAPEFEPLSNTKQLKGVNTIAPPVSNRNVPVLICIPLLKALKKAWGKATEIICPKLRTCTITDSQ